ncbi:polyamine transporter [Lecanosticta acicola]|uniref:Polyamine transporter n=1 Tax=Lecanosticta acicola TaxID=111012 RepID=A0AAI8YT50_9PEZI|nr:polyamine transporter [Lecanosticta acicola]
MDDNCTGAGPSTARPAAARSNKFSAFVASVANVATAAQAATAQVFHSDPADVERRLRGEEENADPNHPRNWEDTHKNTTYWTICLFSFVANANASAFTVAVKTLMQAFHISLTKATSLTALNVLMFGLGNLLWVPMMRVLGKRPVYLLALAVLIGANAWSATAASYGSLLASRMVSGIGASAADATVPSTVGDLWDQKTRGYRGMIFTFFLASGIFLGPLINAWVIQIHGWRWIPGWISIVSGFILVLAIFMVHETEYRSAPNTTSQSSTRRSFLQGMDPTIGLQRDKPVSAFKRSLRDITLMFSYPQILYSSIVIGIFVGWTIIMQISLSQALSSPPYSWSIGHVGNFHFAGWIGVLSALGVVGYYLDKSMQNRRAAAGRARGPPEQRLKLLGIPAAFAPPGLMIYGFLLAKKKGWIGPAIGYALHSFGFAAVSNILVTYCVDSELMFSGEGLVSLFIIRNAIAVACTYGAGAGGWLSASPGVHNATQKWYAAFGTMAGIEWFFLLLAIPVYLLTQNFKSCTEKYGPGRRQLATTRQSEATQNASEGGHGVAMQDMSATRAPVEQRSEEPLLPDPSSESGNVESHEDADVEAGEQKRDGFPAS